MQVLDIFKSNAFGVSELTDYINLEPYEPSFFRTLGLFTGRGIATTTAYVEMRSGVLSLVANRTRSTPGAPIIRPTRRAPQIYLPHIFQEEGVTPEEVQDLKALGETVALEDVQTVVNERLDIMRKNDDMTQEFHMVGAFKGIVYDSEGDVLFDAFDAFGITPATPVSFDFDTDSMADLTAKINGITRLMENRVQMGSVRVGEKIAVCGDEFFDALIGNASVQKSYEDWANTTYGGPGSFGQPGDFAREEWVYKTFPWKGVWWYNYRGNGPDGEPFVETDKAYFGPRMSGIFQARYGPRNTFEGVNQIGVPRYATLLVSDDNTLISLKYESNVAYYCTRPELLVTATAV